MIMTKNNTETIMKDAEISFLFTESISGYLYDEKVFVEMDVINNRPVNVYAIDEDSKQHVAKVLYLVESVTNSLGINLKEDTLFTEEVIQEKIMKANPKLVVIAGDFQIISEGTEVEVFASIQDEEEVEVEKIESVATEAEVERPSVAPLGFSEMLKKAQAEETKVEVEQPVETKAEETTVDSPSVTVDAVSTPELSRIERAAVIKDQILEFFIDASTTHTVKTLIPKIKAAVDFDVSSTEIRNFLVDLATDAKLEQVAKGSYQLASFEQFSLFEDAPVVVEPKTKTETAPATPVKKEVPAAPVAQAPEKAPVLEMVTVNEELKQADHYSALFFDDSEVAEYLKLIGIPSVLADWAIKFRAHNRDRLTSAPQVVVDVIPSELAYLGNKETLMKSLAAMKSDTPLSLKGPAGTGKTTLVDTIGAILNLPVFSINGSLESNKSTLVGEPTIKQQGVISIKDGQMQKAAVYGGILYIDEINMMRPDILSIANSMLDHRKAFYNDVRSEMTFAIKETRFISAMNEGYAGTKQMNKATGDRKLAIRLDYMNKKELKDVLAKILTNTDEGATMSMAERDILVEKVAKLYSILSAKAKQQLVPELAASTRSIIQLVKNVPILGFQLTLEMMFDKFTEEEIAQMKGALTGSGMEEELGVNFTN